MVLAQIRARGDKVQYYSAREIAILTEAELERNRARLIADAEQAVATWPEEFARWRCADIASDAQKQNAQNSMASTGRCQVLNGGAINDRGLRQGEH